MNYVELEAKINELLTVPISRRKIADIIGTSAQNINKKFHNPNTQVMVKDIEKLERLYQYLLLLQMTV